MGFIATNISTIPSGYQWYIFFLTGNKSVGIESELLSYFEKFSIDIGIGNLAVQGGGSEGFYNSLVGSELVKLSKKKGIEDSLLPALVISNRNPSELDESSGIKDQKEINFFIITRKSLVKMQRNGTLQDFMTKLATSLKESNLNQFMVKERFLEKWGWLSKYIKFEISFFFGKLDINQIIEDLMNRE